MTYVGRAFDFNAAHFVHVAADEAEGRVRVVVERTGPAVSAEQVDDLGEIGARVGSGRFGARQQGAERCLTMSSVGTAEPVRGSGLDRPWVICSAGFATNLAQVLQRI